MNGIVCLRHPKYNGRDNPELRCKTCCSIFVNRIKELNNKRALDVAALLEAKSQKAQQTARG